MSRKKHSLKHLSGKTKKEPFSVPDGYFEELPGRIAARIREEMAEGEQAEPVLSGAVTDSEPTGDPGGEPRTIWMRARPYVSLAAAILGFAMLSYFVLQITGVNREPSTGAYDLAMLEQAGVAEDDLVLMEILEPETDEETFSEWDREAMNYLASNEVELEFLLAENETTEP